MTTVSDKIENAKKIIVGEFLKRREKNFKISLAIFVNNSISEDELLNIIAPTLKEEKFCDMTPFRDSLENYELPKISWSSLEINRYTEKPLYPEAWDKFNKATKEMSKDVAYGFMAMSGLEDVMTSGRPSRIEINYSQKAIFISYGNKKYVPREEKTKKLIEEISRHFNDENRAKKPFRPTLSGYDKKNELNKLKNGILHNVNRQLKDKGIPLVFDLVSECISPKTLDDSFEIAYI